MLENGQIAGLDPRAFSAVSRAVNQGLPAEASRIASLTGNALASGQLPIKRAEGDLAITAGQIRLSNARASGDGADVALTGSLDLTIGTIDARLTLSGSERSTRRRPARHFSCPARPSLRPRPQHRRLGFHRVADAARDRAAIEETGIHRGNATGQAGWRRLRRSIRHRSQIVLLPLRPRSRSGQLRVPARRRCRRRWISCQETRQRRCALRPNGAPCLRAVCVCVVSSTDLTVVAAVVAVALHGWNH